jgi:anti-sigma-K factor RskA
MTDTDLHTLSGAYALNALSEFERAAFDRHLAGCPACATEVAELTETASRLAGPVAPVAPPAALRDRVLAQAARTRQLDARPARPAGTPGRWRRPLILAVAAAVALVAVSLGAVVQEQRVRDARQQAAAASRVSSVLAAPDAQVRTNPGPGGTGRVTLVVSQSRDQAVALLRDLPDPGAGRTYQLWMVNGAQATSKGVLGTGTTGGTVLIPGVRGQQTFALTNEPAGGSTTPTVPILATVPLT